MAIPLDLQLRSLRRRIEALFSGYATTVHSHALSDVTGLESALAGKAASSHTHDGLAPSGGTTGQVLKKINATNYNYEWADDATGGGGSDASFVLAAIGGI